jgi:hypothetical protein
VREDYSPGGEALGLLPARPRAIGRLPLGEDGIAGISDRHQMICFALALWNGRDPILKERVFGLTGREANHSEDVKEYYFYLDSTPTHSCLKFRYKCPQARSRPGWTLALVIQSRLDGTCINIDCTLTKTMVACPQVAIAVGKN